ncbi:MAG: SRPBCC family protein [Chloroflexota bacterium]
MTSTTMRFDTVINGRSPQDVFEYVSDLTRHGEWAANPLEITANQNSANGVPSVGQTFTSAATVRSLSFDAQLTITAYEPNSRFSFSGEDSTGKFEHHFSFKAVDGGTAVSRQINFTLSAMQWIIFTILYIPVRKPAGNRALELLKEKLER